MKKQRVFLYFIPQRNEFNICKVRKVEGGVKDVFCFAEILLKNPTTKTHTHSGFLCKKILDFFV